MLRRVFRFLLCMAFALNVTVAPSAVPEATSESPAVNVKYIHDAISAKWGVSVGYNSQLSDKLVIANMKYLMAAIDIANKKIGGSSKVYSGTSYATSYAVNKRTVDNAIKNLIKKPRTFAFTATTTSDTTSFSFKIAAAGEFWVDWGDGSDVQVITKTSTSSQTVSHTYNTAAAYDVRLGGLATAYPTSTYTAAISFAEINDGDCALNRELAGISGSLGAIFPTLSDGTQPQFFKTFCNCANLTSIPENLFAGISGAPAEGVFSGTFSGCSGLTGSIPENLFAGISGAPVSYMFYETFNGCSGLTGSIPEKLFAGISGAPVSYMFRGTFYGCTGLTGNIPENLFAGISGTPAHDMFNGTFYGCSGLTGKIPSNLFGNISGAAAIGMFSNTFDGCSGLTGEIPLGLFGDLSGSLAYHMFYRTFYGCKGLYGKSARNPDGTYLYEVYPSTTNSYTGYMYTGTCLEDNASIPSTWGGATCTYVEPEPENYPFELTMYSYGKYEFSISAAGTFYVNWGDGSAYEKITKNDTTTQTISHTYASKGTYTVKLAGQATAYSTSETTAAISFMEDVDHDDYMLKGISGSLGAIFPTLSDGSQPRFYKTFYFCSGTTGEIPVELFDGIHGAPVSKMFALTFGTSGFTSIPADLFAGIQGAPAKGMFDGTFSHSQITEIPAGLFAGIKGAPAENMFAGTFGSCSKLSGEIPLGLFGDLSGEPAANMFSATFQMMWGTSGLTGKSARNPDGKYLYEVFPTATSSDVFEMYYGTCLYDNASIPSAWGGKACTYTGPIPSDELFTVTTVPNTSSMDIMFNAWGDFTIDWGDGSKETISRTTANTKEQIFSHTYASAGTYEIKFAGTPTGYPSFLTSAASGERHGDVAAIQFRDPYNTSSKCNVASVSGKLGALFPTLTSALTGSGVQPRFSATFSECAQLTEIPAGLFDGITGAPVSSMFNETFSGAGITEIPAGLFDGISGEPMEYIFNAAFAGTPIKSIPAGLFDGINGNAKEMAFDYAFAECTNLTSIPQGLFDGMTVAAKTGYDAFAGTFYGCTALTGPSAQMSDGTYLYNIENFDENIGADMYTGCTGLSDYATMPGYLKGVEDSDDDEPDYPFSVTTVPNTSEFAFVLYATGDYTVDWGDGNVENITVSNNATTPVKHTYTNAGTYTIKFAGLATWGATISTYAAEIGDGDTTISFSTDRTGATCKIASISGSLGKIFPTHTKNGNVAQPAFKETFSGCSDLTSIPSDLFDGVTGEPGMNMFAATFAETGITEIPSDLFKNISGAIHDENVFADTFYGCTKLKYIPCGLLDNITSLEPEATHATAFAEMFAECTSLTGPSLIIGGTPRADGTCDPDTGTYLYDWLANEYGSKAMYNVYGMYRNDTGLDDWDNIPDDMKEE